MENNYISLSGKIIKISETYYLESLSTLYKITDGKSRKPFNQNKFKSFVNLNVEVTAKNLSGILYIYNIRKTK